MNATDKELLKESIVPAIARILDEIQLVSKLLIADRNRIVRDNGSEEEKTALNTAITKITAGAKEIEEVRRSLEEILPEKAS